MSRPEACVGAVVVHEGSLLLVQRGRGPGQGRWSIPGGRVEWGETLATAVERELLEETGLAGRCGRFLGWVERIGPDHHFVIADFLVAVDDPTPLHAGDDAAGAAWVPLDDLAARDDLVEGLVEFLRSAGVLA